MLRQARLVIGNREEMVTLYLSMAAGNQAGAKEVAKEEMGKAIARATFSSPEQKLVVTGGADPIMLVSTEKISYIEVKLFIRMMPKNRFCGLNAVMLMIKLEKMLLQVCKVERVVDTTGAGETEPISKNAVLVS